jgi:hypothetical protein
MVKLHQVLHREALSKFLYPFWKDKKVAVYQNSFIKSEIVNYGSFWI